MDSVADRAHVIVKGVVQGVGFRPYVYTLAGRLGLKGYVTNTDGGVFIDIEGERLDEFVRRLSPEAPPLARISDLSVIPLPFHGYQKFTIRESEDHAGIGQFTLLSPDVSVCDDCLKELYDPQERRYCYPFINCTHCGPRYSITRSIPYDRPNTTMAPFTMCPACLAEYNNPSDRRFHAQPNACSTCGPEVEFRVRNTECEMLEPASGERGVTATRLPSYKKESAGIGVTGTEALLETIGLLKAGGVVAIKGLGGFHIACDATNDVAVNKLRERKRKSNKPFAVMCPDISSVERFCEVSEEEKPLLLSHKRPIVLLNKKMRPGPDDLLAAAVSPNNRSVGCMLPYTPLHYLLFYHPLRGLPDIQDVKAKKTEPHFSALVMTSGNLSEEPIVCSNDEALEKLGGLVDAFLVHNRNIFTRVDDSVVRIRTRRQGDAETDRSEGVTPRPPIPASPRQVFFIRRSRGYAPEPVALHEDGPEVLGCGADLKNTFTLTKGAFAIPSQHIGDMENYETLRFFEESLENLKSVYRVDPVALVHDLHPGYCSTRWAVEKCGVQSAEHGIESTESAIGNPQSEVERFAIQHHYAHIGSVMAEQGLTRKIIGVAFDGTGYGADGNLWGGEILIADTYEFERVGQFKYVPLPGGESAIREPWKTAVSYILDAAGEKAFDYFDQIGFFERYGKKSIEQLSRILHSRDLSPLSSGAGRLFDAVSAILGICDRNTFEGEAAMTLESIVKEGEEGEYPFDFNRENGYTTVDFSRGILGIIEDMVQRKNTGFIATKFHNTSASVIRHEVKRLGKKYRLYDVALSGGTFQNRYLLDRTVRLLVSEGMNVYVNQMVPANDAGISLGQAYIVRERLKSGERER
ncbi:MAG TPA: carbamoyltransferase HypF [Nitrospiraceae bacterium]|nr:carbamoyltransferase HypF [Nitrospiraceae bacterium]